MTGLILWWPLTGKFKQALTCKRHASPVRFNFDLHKTVGIYSTIVLLPVLFSGVYFNLPEQVNALVKLFSPVNRPAAFNSMPAQIRSRPAQAGEQALSLSRVEAIVQEHYPGGQLWMLDGPKSPEGVYKVMKKDVTELSRFIGYSDVAMDQYSGEILKVYDKSIGSSGDRFLDWQWPLHSGHAFGWPGRILVLLSGLACPVLSVTGVIR
nr:PepSY-associated TM helix domain-containing protein [Methylomonas sp. SURF-1]